MLSRQNADGSVTATRRAEGPGGIIGDAAHTVRPGEPGYEAAAEAARHDAEIVAARPAPVRWTPPDGDD